MIAIYTKKIDDISFGVACDDESVFSTNFGMDEKKVVSGLIESLPPSISYQHAKQASMLADRVFALLKDVYNGKKTSTNVPLVMEHLSDYSRRVLRATLLIPLGFVSSYAAVAKTVGGSARAVGRVMATNPFAPLVPCHRVVKSDLTLGGYGGGLSVKLELLKKEQRGYHSEKEVAVGDRRLVVFPVEVVLENLGESKC